METLLRLGTMLLTIKDLAHQLQIKPSTLYAWVAARKIPYIKIHGLLRFQQEEIDRWVGSFQTQEPPSLSRNSKKFLRKDLDTVIARAKREVYSAGPGDQTKTGQKGG